MTTRARIAIALLLSALGLVAIYLGLAHAQQKQPIQIKWLIAHEPVSLFDRAAKDFADEFNKYSDGSVQVTILGPRDFGSNTGHLSPQTVFGALDSGTVQMATVVVGGLGNSVPELQVMNLPFLFTNYQSAEKVFDAEVGKELLSLIDEHTDTHALDFTFSGGFVVIESNFFPFSSPSQFAGKRIGTIDGAMAEKVLSSFGATPVSMDTSRGARANGALLDQYDGIELPYTRIFPEAGQIPKYVLESYHGVFTTAIIVSDTFYNSLSPKNREALQRAADVAAKDERADSIALGARHRQQLLDAGTVIIQLSTTSADALRKAARPVYDAYERAYGSSLIDRIRGEQH